MSPFLRTAFLFWIVASAVNLGMAAQRWDSGDGTTATKVVVAVFALAVGFGSLRLLREFRKQEYSKE
jgi:hypothetical protein